MNFSILVANRYRSASLHHGLIHVDNFYICKTVIKTRYNIRSVHIVPRQAIQQFLKPFWRRKRFYLEYFARISSILKRNTSSESILIINPPKSGRRTLSPTAKGISILLPTANTSPSLAFETVDSGRKIPPAVCEVNHNDSSTSISFKDVMTSRSWGYWPHLVQGNKPSH